MTKEVLTLEQIVTYLTQWVIEGEDTKIDINKLLKIYFDEALRGANVKIVDTVDKSEEWLAVRKNGIGGSEIAAICNRNPYKTRLDVYNEKLGLVEPEDLSNKTAVKKGNDLEPLILNKAEKYLTEKSGKLVRIVKPTFTLYFPDYYAVVNMDGLAISEDGELTIVEAKYITSNGLNYWSEETENTVALAPLHYQMQAWHYQFFTKIPQAVIVGLKETDWELIVAPTNLDRTRYRNECFKAIIDFRDNHILPKFPPLLPEALPKEHWDTKIKLYSTNSSVKKNTARWLELSNLIKEYEAEKKMIESNIKEFISVNKATTLISDCGKFNLSFIEKETLDSEKLKTSYPEVFEACRRSTSYITMRRTALKKDERLKLNRADVEDLLESEVTDD